MDWDRLRILKAVAEAGSFTQAAENLQLNQSSVSRQISTLEDSVGHPLFHRHARGLVLTEQGEVLFHTACDVFDQVQQAQMRLNDTRMLAAGPLKITTVSFLASTLLLPQIPKFKAAYPNIQMTLLLDDRVYDLARREADVALRLRQTKQTELIERSMGKISFALCASKSYLEQFGKPEKASDLAHGHSIIAYPPNTHTPFEAPNQAYQKLNVDVYRNPDVVLVNSMHLRYMAVLQGSAISILPRYLIDRHDDIEILFPNLSIPSVEMFFVYPQERRNSERIKVLRDYLFENLRF